MVIISTVHTGRVLKSNLSIILGVFLIIFATILRVSIAYLPEYSNLLYMSSAIIWVIPFIIYIKQFYSYLLSPRADGIKG